MSHGASLKNLHKCAAIGLKMVDPNLKCNFGTCLEMVRVRDGANKAGQTAINKIYDERAGLNHAEITHTIT